MTDLVKYDAMLFAIDAAHDVDEAKDIRDKAKAIEAYARQAKNEDAERKCCEIRLRAERRCGQILATLEKAKGASGGGKREGLRGKIVEPRSNVATLADHRISKGQSSQWQAMAKVPDPVFEQALAGEQPTSHRIAQLGRPTETKADPPASTSAYDNAIKALYENIMEGARLLAGTGAADPEF